MVVSRQRTAGFTLVELMAVVAIIGVLSALGLAGIVEISKFGRVNGSATMLARILANARTRSITERCMYVVQVSGSQWAPGLAAGPDVRPIPRSIQVYRKANCNSLNGYFETGVGDRFIEELNLDDSNGNILMATAPAGVVPGDVLGTTAIAFSWTPTGARQIFVDTTGTTTWVQNNVLLTAFFFTLVPVGTPIPPPLGAVQRVVSVPPGGPAVAQ